MRVVDGTTEVLLAYVPVTTLGDTDGRPEAEVLGTGTRVSTGADEL